MPVARQVWFAFGTVCAILLAIGGLLFFGLRAIERGNQHEQSRALKKLAVIDDLAQDVGQLQADVTREGLASDINELNFLDQRIRSLEETNAAEFRDFQSYLEHAAERQAYDDVMRARKLYWEQTQLVMALDRANQDAEATKLILAKQAPAYDHLVEAVNKLIEHVEGDANDSAAAMTALISTIRIVGDCLVAVAILIVLGAGFAVARVARRLKEDNRLLEIEVGERKRAEDQLGWKTALLEAQLNSSPDGILVLDEMGRKILQNQRTVDLLRLPKHIVDDPDGEKQLQWVLGRAKDRAQLIEYVKYIRSNPTETKRDEVEFQDGLILDRYSAPVIGTDGKSYGRIWAFRDITERRRGEEQLRLKSALLEAQLNATIDGILIVDKDRKMVLQNQRLLEMFKMSSHIADEAGDEKRLQWVIDLVKDPERFTQKVHYLYAHSDEVSSDEVELVDGRILDRYSAPVIGKNNEYYGRIWTFRDMTERKREADKLRDSDEKFRQLAENINDVFWMTSPDLQQVLYVSPAYEQVWGRSAAKAVENPREWSDAILPEERERVFAAFGQLMVSVPSVSAEFQIARPGGELRCIHSRGFQVRDAAGKVIRLTGVASDITERKKLEARSFQAQKMETVGKLAGGIAHEFNSILTAIIGQCEMMQSELPPEGALAKSAVEINQAATRAAALTRQLLAYGRKQFLQPELLDFNRVIAGMDSVFRLLMGGNVATQIIPTSDLKTVMADAGQIEQVILNIVINARDAMPNGGRLILETANVSFEEESVGRYAELKPGEYVMLAITDTGAGMSEQVKARLFEPFFTTKGVGQGTGLGLSTCYGIIKQSGGHISAYSEVGRGSTFKIYLPQAEQQKKAPVERPSSPGMPRGTETIMLVEDDPALREMATTLLRRLGYTVWPAANGVEALSLKQQRTVGHIDLLLTDVVMPHMSGKELADRVEALFPHTKILFTSAYTESAIVQQGVLNKGVVLLQKPFTPSALARKVREVLEQTKQA
jgi:PAS domain S-box-containing protein